MTGLKLPLCGLKLLEIESENGGCFFDRSKNASRKMTVAQAQVPLQTTTFPSALRGPVDRTRAQDRGPGARCRCKATLVGPWCGLVIEHGNVLNTVMY